MAFDPDGLSDVAALNRGRTLFEYGTRDPLASVLAAGYFDAAHGLLTTGDSILVSADDGEAIVRAAIVNGGAVVAVSQGGAGTANLGFAANELGLGTVERTLATDLRDLGVPVTRFGAIAGGSAAVNNAAFQAAADEGIPILVPPGAFDLSAEIEITEPSTKFVGRHRRHSRLVSSYPFIFRLREGADDFHCLGLGLESTDDTESDLFYGLIRVNNESVDGIHIERCYFSAPDANTNALGLYADKADGSNLIQNIWFLDNIVENMGNSGMCFQNHLHDSVAWRIKNFWVQRNLFRNMGLVSSEYGMIGTYTGRVANGWVSHNVGDNLLGIGLEMANGNYNVHFLHNGFKNITRRGYGSATNPISISSGLTPKIPHYSCRVVGNYSEAGQSVEGGLFFGNMEGLVLSDNSFDLKDNVTIRDSNDATGVGNKFRCQGAKGFVFEGTSGASCKRNQLLETQVDMSDRSTAVTAVVSFEGTSGSCDGNVLIGGKLSRPGAGGAYVVTNDSANSRNMVERMSTNAETWAPRLKTISMSDADFSVNLIDAQYEVIRLTGALTATRGVNLPREGKWIIYNNTTGGQSVSVAPNGGTGVTVANGVRKVIQTRTGDTNDYTPFQLLTGTATYDAASLADGAGATTTVTVSGAAVGDFVIGISHGVDLQGITVTGYVSATNTVSVRFQNESTGTLDLASGTLRVAVLPKSQLGL